MYKHLGALATLGLSALLTACGGHGGGDAAGNGNPSSNAGAGSNAFVEGAWSGSNAKNDTLDLLLLENGDLYAMFSSVPTGQVPTLVFDKGRYSVSGNMLTATVVQYNDNGSTVSGTLGATVQAGVSITGSASNTGSTASNTFSVTPTSAVHAGYNYSTPAALSDIAGAWTSTYLLGQNTPFALSITPSGALAATDLGCSIAGSITPRSSGKNVFNISLSFGQSPCRLAGQTVAGVAISYLRPNGQRQLSAAMLDSSKAQGAMLYAQR